MNQNYVNQTFVNQKSESEIPSLKLTSTVSAPKMTALELRKQSLIHQPSSQEAVEAIYAVLNPTLSQNHAQYLCTMKNKLIVTVYD